MQETQQTTTQKTPKLTPKEKLEKYELMEKKLQARMQKIRAAKAELTEKGQLQKNRTKILIQAGLALAHAFHEQVKTEAHNLQAIETEIKARKANLDHKNLTTDQLLTNMMNTRKATLEKLEQTTQTFFSKFFQPYLEHCAEQAEQASDPKKREKAISIVNTNFNLIKKMLSGICNGDFK